MTPAERAVINAAIRQRQAGIHATTHEELIVAIDALKHDDGCICPTDERVYCESAGCRGGADLPAEPTEQAKIWVAITIDQVRSGDRIRMLGRDDTQQTVEGVSPLLRWHVHPAANPYRPNENRAEWKQIRVGFADREEWISFTDPSFPIEIETTETEADAVALLGGRGARA